MKIRDTIVMVIVFLFAGCVGIFENGPYEDCNGNRGNNQNINNNRLNSYCDIPLSVKELIAPFVKGYFSPDLDRYCEYLYPSYIKYNPYNLPCYVRADFNGDLLYDYAFLFSKDEWCGTDWYVTTRLLVVLSTSSGIEIAADIDLGTVSANASVPVEEYWSICFLPPGLHTVVKTAGGLTITETIELDNESFFLASLDPDEEAIFYAVDDDLYEFSWSDMSLQKSICAENRSHQKRGIIYMDTTHKEHIPMVKR